MGLDCGWQLLAGMPTYPPDVPLPSHASHASPPHPTPAPSPLPPPCPQTYVDFMSRFTGRDKEEVRGDVGRNRYFTPDQAVEYGIIDKVMQPSDAVVVSACGAGSSRAPAVPACRVMLWCKGSAAVAAPNAVCSAAAAPLASRSLPACLCHRPHHLQIERRDYEGQLRASQSQSRSGWRSSGAMAGADA